MNYLSGCFFWCWVTVLRIEVQAGLRGLLGCRRTSGYANSASDHSPKHGNVEAAEGLFSRGFPTGPSYGPLELFWDLLYAPLFGTWYIAGMQKGPDFGPIVRAHSRNNLIVRDLVSMPTQGATLNLSVERESSQQPRSAVWSGMAWHSIA